MPVPVPLYAHVFGNVGSIQSIDWSKSVGSQINSMGKELRSAVGVGIVMPLLGARVEFNYCWSLNKMRYDQSKHFQFGLGLEFVV